MKCAISRRCRHQSARRTTLFTTIALALAVTPAFAGSAIPLEQAAAASTGKARFVVNAPGSFFLSRSIVITNQNDAIAIMSDNVTIDFRGNSIIGKGATGVAINAGSRSQITIQNGNVVKMGSGVIVGADSTVRSMHVTGCSEVGIETGASSVVTDNSATGNGGDGISASGIVRGNVSDDNQGSGIVAGPNTTLTGNEASGNTGFGMKLQEDDGYADNVINGNHGGTISGGVAIGGNLCNGSTVCP